MPPAGHTLFARYAFPPNELGYCGPENTSIVELASRARDFDGAWPYLAALAEAGGADPLDDDVVRSYWVGGPLLDRVEPAALLARLRAAFAGQVTGLLADLPAAAAGVAPHHSFHVFVVYPWIRFLDRDPATALRILQSCRIRWGTIVSVDGEHAVIASRPLTFDGRLALGESVTERVRWRRDGLGLVAPPAPGGLVAAHWDWVCGELTTADAAALDAATQATLDLVNRAR